MRTVSFARRALLSTLLCASLSAGAFAGAVGVSASTTAPAKLAKPSCSTVTQKMIKQYLNLTVSAPRVSAAKGVPDFLCEYGDSVSSLAVVIEYNSASTVASFMSMKDSFDNNNEPPVGTGKSFGTLVNMSFSATLGSGEREAISLALERRADAILIDDGPGRSAAKARNLTVNGTLFVVLEAALQGELDFELTLARLRQVGFRFSQTVEDEMRRRYLKRKTH